MDARKQQEMGGQSIIELNLRHPPLRDAASRYATSALAEEFLNENRHLVEQPGASNNVQHMRSAGMAGSQSMNQRYTNTAGSSEADEES